MSKRRLVITAVLSGISQSEVVRTYNVSQGWISRLMTRYREEGEAAFEPRSRRPLTSPNATAAETVELVLRLRKELDEAGHTPEPDILQLIQGLHVRIINAATGEILRDLIIEPSRDDHGTGRQPGPAPKKQ